MTTLYPVALDNFANPSASQSQNASRTHSEQHGDLNDAVEALQAALGITGSAGTPISLRADLASAVAAKGSALVTHLPAGASAVAVALSNYLNGLHGVPVTNFATDAQLAIDATDATTKAIAEARASGKNAVYFPGGRTYRFAAASASIDPGVDDIVFYGENTKLIFEEGTGVGDINTQRKSLFRNNANVTKGSVTFRGLSIKGTWAEKSYVEGGGAALFLDYYDEIVIEGCHFSNLSWMATACEYTKNVRVLGGSFDTICRDMVRFRSSFNVQVIGNRFKHGVDDCVALHSNQNLSGGDLREGIVVANNIFEDTGGIKVLAGRMVSIHHNIMRRVKTFPIAVYSDVGSAAEANSAMFGISICDNQVYDSLNGNTITSPVSQVIYLGSRIAEAGSDSSNVIPGQNVTATGAFPLPWDSRGSTYSSTTNGVPPPFFITVRGNTIARTLPAVGAYSTWGFGQLMTAAGFTDPAITDAALRPSNGINLSGQTRKALIEQNVVSHVAAAVGVVDAPLDNYGLDDVVVSRNIFSDFNGDCIRLPTPAGSRTVGLRVLDNTMDGDPYHVHSNRGTGGAWLADGSPSVIACTSYFGIKVERNKVRNVCRIVNNGGGSGTTMVANVLRCAPAITGFSTSNKGIGNLPDAGAQAIYEHVDSDPTSATYGGQVTTMQLTSGAMPATGTYVRGTFVQAIASTTIAGWQRLTTGSAHVAGTDWKTIALT